METVQVGKANFSIPLKCEPLKLTRKERADKPCHAEALPTLLCPCWTKQEAAGWFRPRLGNFFFFFFFFPMKSQIVTILGFAGHTIFATVTQLCHGSVKVAVNK